MPSIVVIGATIVVIDGTIGAVNAFIDRVDATGIRVLVAARRQGRTVRVSPSEEHLSTF